MEAKWKVSVEYKAFNIGFEIWKDLGMYRRELIEKKLRLHKNAKKKKTFYREHVQELKH